MSNWQLYEGKSELVLPTLETGLLDAVVTDPPYDVNLNKDTCGWDQWPDPLVWRECYRVTKPTGLMAVIIAPHVAHERIGDVIAAGWRVLEVGFWVWGNGRPVNVDRLKRCFDLVYFMGKTSRVLFTDQSRGNYRNGAISGGILSGTSVRKNKALGRQFGEVADGNNRSFTYGADSHPANVACEIGSPAFGDSGYERIFAVKRLQSHGLKTHPTQKPDDLMAQIIKLVSNEGDTVLDPFMGHGTTLKTALQLGRKAVGIDSNAEYVEAARREIINDAPLFNMVESAA